MNLSKKVESAIWLILGTMAGIIIPIVIVSTIREYTRSEYDLAKVFLPFFVIAAVSGSIQGYAFSRVREKREAIWIAPAIGFNIGFGAYLILGLGLTGHDTYLFPLLCWSVMFLVSVIFTLTESNSLLPPPRRHPGRLYD